MRQPRNSSSQPKDVQQPGQAAERRSGARAQRISRDQQYQSWMDHHRQIALDSGQRLLRSPIASLFTMLAIAIALVLPAMLWLGLGSVRTLDSNLESTTHITVYLQAGESPDSVNQIAGQIRGNSDVQSIQLITADQGLDEFQHSLGIGNVASLLSYNPLPATILVTPNSHDPQAVSDLASQLQGINGVDESRVDVQWLQRLHDIGRLGQRMTWGLFVLFGFGALLVVGNTIRLSVANRHKEIEVVTLLGATRPFVRRPFLYMGAWFGLGGGILAIVLLLLGRGWLSTPINDLAQSYGSSYQLPLPGFGGSLLLIIVSILLGLLGAWIAVARHLSQIRPE